MWHWGIVFGCWNPVTWPAWKQSPIPWPTSACHITVVTVPNDVRWARQTWLGIGWCLKVWMSLVKLARLLNMAFIGILCSALHAMLHPGSVEAGAGCWRCCCVHSKILVMRWRSWGKSANCWMHLVFNVHSDIRLPGWTDGLNLPDIFTTLQFQSRNQYRFLCRGNTVALTCGNCISGMPIVYPTPTAWTARNLQVGNFELIDEARGCVWYNPKLSLCFLTVQFDEISDIIWHQLASFGTNDPRLWTSFITCVYI